MLRRAVCTGVAQSSVLESDIWMSCMIAIIAVNVTRKSPSNVRKRRCSNNCRTNQRIAQITLNAMMRCVQRWMTEYGLQIALQETEIKGYRHY